MPSLLAKMKVFLILEENSWKIEIKLFPWQLELVSDILWAIVVAHFSRFHFLYSNNKLCFLACTNKWLPCDNCNSKILQLVFTSIMVNWRSWSFVLWKIYLQIIFFLMLYIFTLKAPFIIRKATHNSQIRRFAKLLAIFYIAQKWTYLYGTAIFTI